MRQEIKDIAEKYGADANIIDMVHKYLQADKKEKAEERIAQGRIGKFYPSSVGRCKRQIGYQMAGYPGKEIPGRNLLIMENGTYFHHRMEDLFEKMGIMITPELKLVHNDLRISGRSDAIVWNYLRSEDEEDGEVITLHAPDVDENGNEIVKLVYSGPENDVMIVEFKSIKSKKYEKLPKTKPDNKHNMQLQLYMYLTGIRRGAVYYENKDTQEQKYYYVVYDPKVVQAVIDDILFVISYIDRGELPPKEYPPTSFECTYCDFKDICHPVTSSYNLDDIL